MDEPDGTPDFHSLEIFYNNPLVIGARRKIQGKFPVDLTQKKRETLTP